MRMGVVGVSRNGRGLMTERLSFYTPGWLLEAFRERRRLDGIDSDAEALRMLMESYVENDKDEMEGGAVVRGSGGEKVRA